MSKFSEIDVSWKRSEKGKVCTAFAVDSEGNILAKAHVTIPRDVSIEIYKSYGNLGDEEVENAAKVEVVFMLDNPELFQ